MCSGKHFLNWIALLLLVIGGLNWGLVGLFDYNVVTVLFGSMTMISRIIYVVVGVAALYAVIFILFKRCCKCPPSA
jgi:uncharacterized membrane protein YuzA (DUF378 family)